MQSPISRRKNAGYTMLELAFTAAILALALGGFFAAFGGSNDYAVRARLRNSAKVVLGAALNEALGSRWVKALPAPLVLQPTSGPVPYDVGAFPNTPLVNNLNLGVTPTLTTGEMSLFTDPNQNAYVVGHLSRDVSYHPSYPGGSVVIVKFSFYYTYKGVDSQPIEAYTVVSRLD